MSPRKPHDDADAPLPFGVDYVPPTQRVKPKTGRLLVGKVFDIPPGRAKAVPLENFRLAVFNVNGKFYAIKDACPHAEYPLSKGALHEEVVMCASHNWQFNVRTGQCIRGNPDIEVRTFPVEVVNDEIWVKL